MSKARPLKKYQTNNSAANTEALIYCRVSSERQANEGHGLDSQEKRCRDYVSSKGYMVAEVFRDTASGGGEYSLRPGQVEIVRFIDSYPHKRFVVVIDDISRIARDAKAHMTFRAVLRELGVEMESPNFNFEDTPEGEVIENVMAAFSQYHRQSNRRQVIQKQKARLESGYWPFGSKKGYVMVRNPMHGKVSIPHPELAPILVEALEGFASGRFPRKIDVCRFLVEKDFWTKQKPEKYIDKVHEILVDPFHAGYVDYKQWDVNMIPGKHQAIISMETHEAIKKRLARPEGKRIRKDVSDDFPLRGLLVCAVCGCNITAAKSKGRSSRYPYYFCQNKECSECGKSCKKDLVEEGFVNLLNKGNLKDEVGVVAEEVFDRVWNQSLKEFNSSQNSLKSRLVELKQLRGDLSIRSVKAATEAIREAYEEQMEEVSKEIKQRELDLIEDTSDIEVPYKTALDKSMQLLKNPYEAWIKLDTRTQQEVFRFIFDQKLPFARDLGYKTANIPSAVMLFGEFACSNPFDVEVAGIEPASKRVRSFFVHIRRCVLLPATADSQCL